MPRKPRPWYRTGVDAWYVKLDGRQIRLAVGKASEGEAWAALHRLLASEGRGEARSDLTVSEAAELYLDHCRATTGPLTYGTNRARLQVVSDHLGRERLAELTPGRIERFLAEARVRPMRVQEGASRPRKPRSDATLRAWLVALRQAVRHCRRERLYDGPDPLEGVKLPPTVRRERFLDLDEQRALLAVARGPIADFLRLQLATGARPHVLAELEARHVDWASGEARLPSKRRTYLLVVPRTLLARLRELAELHPTGPLLRNFEGQPWTRNALRLQFRRLCQRAGIPPASPYAVRHGVATEAVAGGENVAMVAQLMNHADLTMFARHYSHLGQKRAALREAAEGVAARLEAVDQAEPSAADPPPVSATTPRPAKRPGKRRPPRE
jgi:integrase